MKTQITKLALIIMIIVSAVACKKNEVTPVNSALTADFDLVEDTVQVTMPIISISIEEARFNITFNMINKSTSATNFLWKFSSGDLTSTDQNPSFTFHYLSEFEPIMPGLYRKEVKLIASNSNTSRSAKKFIYVRVVSYPHSL
ncbi:MAG TPA: hypothetical protein PKO18_00220 [Chitinophagales bacterium]|nr:hypothetical protein [Chitinophagales bacterium]HNL83625.1 hypothetical protein [Chitinophagales bacterium]